ncbi:hypothetical protein [Amycolatopsis sp. FDAARGOS 1241]|uniref:hypothetical protein n=1 Tax=Amycolatopsis sp. FDAARGOS 1241 TaxID=2778070 RepID=UPI0019527FE6|nr:hypothetical protein [Amycolatopsis sp. FDAARGOS 1241]QRP44705.1 hypothetical protein I6J71_36560 [Amycolatopsis sp. FDAARGOS 1241]
MRRWFGSTKNLFGCIGGLLGLVLYVVGVVGPLWLMVVVVAVLYAAGALLGPPDKVRLVVDPEAEAVQVRSSLDALAHTVSGHAGRLPASAVDGVRRVAEMLSDLLADPARLAANPDLQHRVLLLARTDLPLSVQTYLNLPRWFAASRADAGHELVKQLDLIEHRAHQLAEEYYAAEVNQQKDQTRYLGEDA